MESFLKTALTDRAIKAMRPSGKAYDVHDALVPGLTLNVLPSGLKRFVLLRRFPGSTNPTRRALGSYGELTLEAARSKARKWLELIARGIDPAEESSASGASANASALPRSLRWSRTTSASRSTAPAARSGRVIAPRPRPSPRSPASSCRYSATARSPS
jgi:hypothetical protein